MLNRAYNVFFVFSHGELVPSTESSGTFEIPPQSILLYTGAGQPGCIHWSTNKEDQDRINMFDPSSIKQTFAAFLGLFPAHEDILYKVHGDTKGAPDIAIHFTEEDIHKGGIWGVYKHNGKNFGGKILDNVDLEEEMTELLGKTEMKASQMVEKLNQSYEHAVNIVCFISCRVAFRDETCALMNYVQSASPFLEATHYSTGKSHTMEIYVPRDKKEMDQPLTLQIYDSSRIVHQQTLHSRERNVLVSDILQAMKDGGILPAETTGFNSLENDVLLSGQLDRAYLKNGQYYMTIVPIRNQPTRKRGRKTETYGINQLTNIAAKRRGGRRKTKRAKKVTSMVALSRRSR